MTHQGTRYEPTPEDVLWLLRAVEAEGAPHELVAQTLINGFLWAREKLASKRTLAQWAQSYAVPISPLWMPGGEKYTEAMATARSDTERTAIDQQAMKRQNVFATRTRFSASTLQGIRHAFTHPPRYPGAIDYAAAWVQKAEGWRPFTFPGRGEHTNKLWARPGAVGWRGYLVEGAAPDLPEANTGVGPWLATAAAIGVLAMARQRQRRGIP